MFYNTGIATYIWVVTNRKEKRRKGKVQLIDATSLKSPLRKNLGNKNCELTAEIREQIMGIYLKFEENEYSKIFDNEEFGYWKITVERPLRDENGLIVKDKKEPKSGQGFKRYGANTLTYEGGIGFSRQCLCPDAWIDHSKTQIGYEISFTKYFYKPVQLRDLEEGVADIKALGAETEELLHEIIGG